MATRRLERSAADFVPPGADLAGLAEAARSCRGCDLAGLENSGTVFGEGPPDARVVLVGEQPGDVEDRRGRPLVGPPGKRLDPAPPEGGLQRGATHGPHPPKHLKFTPGATGKRPPPPKPDRPGSA